MQSASARHIAIVRFLCGLGEQFSVTDLYRNAIAFSGHRFTRTTFKTRQNGARAPLFYCRAERLRCGMNLQRTSLDSHEMVQTAELEFARSANLIERGQPASRG